MNAPSKYVLYHGNCPDGFTAAWAAWKALGEDAKYIPVIYGRDLPDIEENRTFPPIVYIVDFSYPRETLISLNERAVVRVLDHHKTAEADLAGLHFCTFDMNKSGAMLSWEYFHPGRTPAPRIVQYAQDRDLWRWALPNSKEISAWYLSYDYGFETWDKLEAELQTNYPYVVAEGQAILRSKDQMVNTMAKQARMMVVGGYQVPVANATVAFSEVGNVLCEMYPTYPFAAYYFDRKDGKRHWGLRSIGDFDVSETAKQYGGGGHKNASGFISEIADFSVSPSR